jgi:hypothetical protein
VVALSLLVLLEAVLTLVLLEAEAGNGVAAHWRQLQTAALLSQAAERGILPLSFFSVSFGFLSPVPSPFFRFTLIPLPFLSLSVFFVLLPSPLFFFVSFSPSVLSSSPQRSWGSIYRAQGVALLWSMGSNRPVGHWARLPRFGPPPRFSGKCAVGGRPLCPVGGLQVREWPAKIQKKSFLFSFFPAA